MTVEKPHGGAPLDLALWCRACHGSLANAAILARHLRSCAELAPAPSEALLFWPRPLDAAPDAPPEPPSVPMTP